MSRLRRKQSEAKTYTTPGASASFLLMFAQSQLWRSGRQLVVLESSQQKTVCRRALSPPRVVVVVDE